MRKVTHCLIAETARHNAGERVETLANAFAAAFFILANRVSD
jgi:hypothetical protein